MSHCLPSKRRLLLLAAIMLLVVLPAGLAKAQFEIDQGDEAKPSVIAETQSLQPGQTTTVAVHFDIKPKWHLYWTNPEGDGATPAVTWTLPEGYSISEPRWPAPQTFIYVGSNHYGYDNQLTILFDLTVPAGASGEAKLVAGLTWLVCDESNCVPSPGFPNRPVEYSLTLPVKDQPAKPSESAGLIRDAERRVPRPAPGWSVQAEPTSAGFTLTITAPTEADAQALQGLRFYNDQLYAIDPDAQQTLQVSGKTLTLALKQRKTDAYGTEIKRDQPITELTGVLKSTSGFGKDGPIAIPVGERGGPSSNTNSADPTQGDPANKEGAAEADPGQAGDTALGFLPALGFAFLGGMILNLMPCVFPVLSIKILGFVQIAGEKAATVRRHGYAFGVGVMVSFWALIAIILALRTTIDLSWGFQLQNPIFVLSMVLLCFLVGLNLLGTFEIGVGLSAKAGQASQKVAQDGYAKSFFTGVLATLIATPCAAPFMAPAVGAAFIMPNAQAFLVFSMLGAGMATPYVLLSCFPKLLNYLPKPGAWMESFKQAMAFPMFATAGWLALSYIKLIDIEIADVLLMSLSAIALGMWVLGRWSTPIRSARTRWIGRVVAACFVLFGLAYIQTSADKILDERKAREQAREAGTYVYEWIDFTPQKVDELRAQGRPVLIDFTASWCGICQDNKRRVLRTDESKAFYEQHNVALIEADFTAYNSDISKVLDSFKRRSVPLYLVYPPGQGEAKPVVLPNVLTMDALTQAIEAQTNDRMTTKASATASP